MKLFTYIRYFFFLAWNWNPFLAVFMIRHEIRGEKKYSINTTGFDELKHLQKKGIDISHATIYMPANYYLLEKLMQAVCTFPHNRTFLDIGSGKGRAMAVAAHYGFETITGIDLSQKFCEEAKANLRVVQQQFPQVLFNVMVQDVIQFEIPAGMTTIFLFNPFDNIVMSLLVENILKSQAKNPRTIRIIYVNPLQVKVFLENGFVTVFQHKKMKYLQGCILERKAG